MWIWSGLDTVFQHHLRMLSQHHSCSVSACRRNGKKESLIGKGPWWLESQDPVLTGSPFQEEIPGREASPALTTLWREEGIWELSAFSEGPAGICSQAVSTKPPALSSPWAELFGDTEQSDEAPASSLDLFSVCNCVCNVPDSVL